MIRRKATIDRMTMRVEEVLANFGRCLDEFEKSKVFSGPSTYFHKKAVALRKNKSLQEAANDDALIEAVYATLASWGMHRSGPKGAKLVEFAAFKSGIKKAVSVLSELESKRLGLLSGESESVADKVWEAITLARSSASKTQIVAGTKALHHFLPDLIVPIDRNYTLRFFYSYKVTALGNRLSEKCFRSCNRSRLTLAQTCPAPARCTRARRRR